MEVTLVIVTLISLSLAIAMGILTWRLLQEERLRADARVAALEQGLADSLQSSPPAAAEISEIRTGQPSTTASSQQFVPSTMTSTIESDGEANPRSRDMTSSDLAVGDDTDWLAEFKPSGAREVSIGRSDMFATAQQSDRQSRLSGRAIAIAAVAAVMIGAVLAFWTIGRLMSPPADPNPAAAASAPTALELISLQHTQQDGALTITGLVRNPNGGRPQERLTAVVFFFDAQGGFLTSTRAPLDFRALAPGDESPFHLSAPAPPGVSRYRVSFRREEGAIVPHIDRRPQEASRS
jgi:hypothetical protein